MGVLGVIWGGFGAKLAFFDASKALFWPYRTESGARRTVKLTHTLLTTRVVHALTSPFGSTIGSRRSINPSDLVIIDVPRLVHHAFTLCLKADLTPKRPALACFTGPGMYPRPGTTSKGL